MGAEALPYPPTCHEGPGLTGPRWASQEHVEVGEYLFPLRLNPHLALQRTCDRGDRSPTSEDDRRSYVISEVEKGVNPGALLSRWGHESGYIRCHIKSLRVSQGASRQYISVRNRGHLESRTNSILPWLRQG